MAAAERVMCRRGLRVLALALAFAACEPAKTPVARAPASPAAASSSSPVAGVAAAVASPWDEGLGPVLATPALDSDAPVIFARDTASGADIAVDLFNRQGRVSAARLHPGAASRSCAWRRTGALDAADGRAVPNGWLLALAPGVAAPIGVDAVGGLAQRDSAAMVARISRLVSAMPEDSLSMPFRGLPIVVRDAWRFQLPDSTMVNVAIAMRSLNLESNPRAQAVTLIAESGPSSGTGEWRTAFAEQVAGPEDRVEGMDLLAALELGGGRPAVALVRESDTGVRLDVVERTGPATWSVRWSSSTLRCAPD